MENARDAYSWPPLPSGGAGEDEWSDFKKHAFDELVLLIKQADREFASEPPARMDRQRELRREHHLIVVADRIRRGAPAAAELSSAKLRAAAEFILDRSAYLQAGEQTAPPRSPLEDKMLGSARVAWHKLMRRAGSRPELRGGWGSFRPAVRGSVAIIRKIASGSLKPAKRAELWREYLDERIEHLLAVTDEIVGMADCQLSRNDRLVIRDLENLLLRLRSSRRAEVPGDGDERAKDAGSPEQPAATAEGRPRRRGRRVHAVHPSRMKAQRTPHGR